MAKKRVHELAKQYDMPTAEVLKKLAAAGIKVKAAASAVDEEAADRALTGKPPKPAATKAPSGNGQPGVSVRTGPGGLGGGPLGVGPLGRGPLPPKPKPKPRADGPSAGGARGAGQGGHPSGRAGGQRTGGAPGTGSARPGGAGAGAGAGAGRGGQGGPGGAGTGAGGPGGPGSRRPTRSSLQGERAPGAQGGVRRVVIDSQASRRPGGPGGGFPGGGPGGGPGTRPGGPGAGPGGPNRRPRRGGSRRARKALYEAQQEEALASGPKAQANKGIIRIPSGSTVKDVAEHFGVSAAEVIKKLMMLGEMATLTQTLTDDAIQVIAAEFDKEVEVVSAAEEAEAEPVFDDADEDLQPRAPVVTIMGHVDHGKTSLLDAIRETEVAAGEAGGITQHIGAYQVHVDDDRIITFLDTPGHEAFTAMRARGAQVTDIAVIVVAADDGVKPQTREAVDHAKAAKVPMLVAVNKIDKEGAQPDRVRTEMTTLGLQPEEWGGDTMFVDVSAKQRLNLDDLLESILLLAEVADLKANPDAEASGVVIESKLDPGRGAVVTILVNRGSLKVGDAVVAGAHWGRVRAMNDYTGKRVPEALPSEPVEVLGFDSVPEAGEYVRVVENDRKARQLASERAHRLKTEAMARRSAGRGRISLETMFERQSDQAIKDLNLVLKADVSGSLEAFEDEIARLPQEEVSVNIISSGVGGITESDVMLAAASDAIVLGFNVRPVGDARQVADREDVEIRTYAVIYKAIDEIRDAMQGLLAPEQVEHTVGTVEVRQVFRASRIGTIAGSYVTDGRITRGAKVRLVRDGRVVYDGEIASLRRFNDDVREVASGYECGITLKDFQDVKEGDQLEVYETRQVERTLQ
jgi:translation initiation factor IF-2